MPVGGIDVTYVIAVPVGGKDVTAVPVRETTVIIKMTDVPIQQIDAIELNCVSCSGI